MVIDVLTKSNWHVNVKYNFDAMAWHSLRENAPLKLLKGRHPLESVRSSIAMKSFSCMRMLRNNLGLEIESRAGVGSYRSSPCSHRVRRRPLADLQQSSVLLVVRWPRRRQALQVLLLLGERRA